MKRILTLPAVAGLLLAVLGFSFSAPHQSPENGLEFWASFPPSQGDNEALLLRFRDEIVSAAGLEGGFEKLDLPAHLRKEQVTILGTQREGVRYFAAAFDSSEAPLESTNQPNWSRQGAFLVWASESFPRGLLKSLVESVPKPDSSMNRRFRIHMQADWMGLPRIGDSQVVELPGGSLGQALASLDQVEIQGTIEDSVEMIMEARFTDPAQAAIVADAWCNFLLGFQGESQGAQQIVESLSRARVIAEGRSLEIRVPLTLPALERLQHAQASRQFLHWAQLGHQREASERAPDLLEALGAVPGARIADLGAGSGFFTLRLARAVGPQGKILAVDINPQVLERLRQRVEASHLKQIEVIEGGPSNPGLEDQDLDAVLIVNAYHEMPAYSEILLHLKKSLRPGGKVVLLEPYSPEREKQDRAEQIENHQIAPELVARELEEAGFEVVRLDREFIGNPHEDHSHHNGLVVAQKPAS